MNQDEVLLAEGRMRLIRTLCTTFTIGGRDGLAQSVVQILDGLHDDHIFEEAAKESDLERIVNELTDWLILTTPPGLYPTSTHRLNARALLERFPHIAEGWPTDER